MKLNIQFASQGAKLGNIGKNTTIFLGFLLLFCSPKFLAASSTDQDLNQPGIIFVAGNVTMVGSEQISNTGSRR